MAQEDTVLSAFLWTNFGEKTPYPVQTDSDPDCVFVGETRLFSMHGMGFPTRDKGIVVLAAYTWTTYNSHKLKTRVIRQDSFITVV